MNEDGVSLVFTAEDEIQVDDPALRPFAVGLGHAPRVFATSDALRWSKAGLPGHPTEEEIIEHLRRLIVHGLLAVEHHTWPVRNDGSQSQRA